jgi:methionine synthase I (cobalamin-dependent)
MHRTLAKLLRHGPVLTGGPYGTELQARGLAPGESADAWNLLRPNDVEAVARTYVDAGAKVLLTNTFQANELCLQPHGLNEMMEEINFAGVEIGRAAAGRRGFVFGSIGPMGELGSLERAGPAGEMMAWLGQSDTLADAGADALVLETLTDEDEALRAVEDTAASGPPLIVSLAVREIRNPTRLAARLHEAGAAAIGLNCLPPHEMLPLCRRLRKATRLPLWMKPSAGLPRREGGALVYDMTPEEFADGAVALVEAGAAFIGGCCGAGPAHIAALAARLRHL